MWSKRVIAWWFFKCSILVCGAAESLKFETMWLKEDSDRIKLQDAMQRIVDKTPKKEFDVFDADAKKSSSNPVLQYYDRALDRLLNDIPGTRVEPGTAVIWYLYNMGAVIKTPEVCFGVDIHHRRAEELEPLLDFTAVTHNHGDHYSLPLLRKMAAAGKPVISNFFPAAGYTKAEKFTHTVKGVTIHCSEADHNPTLRKFTMPMEFVCPTGDKKFVFFTSGDCFSHEFLEKISPQIDVYILHPRCGMDPVKAVEKLEPLMTFIGHLLELNHEIDRWRWPFSLGRSKKADLKAIGRDSYVPVWGEKFLWDGKKVTGAVK